ncbi:hypothetical protein FA13DRAFT_1798085 [Coprinellus micaceus]|uniref:CxC1-like cysteine cluster associated with KDZ transposases domain-containing protein n=1 Tax=Coprinellus micaceus TaxID=71717 RepID=A0A4Y7SNW0_COPMI|nr:hypothetical protein FA13DRAFT_1798085 [Coprinellus micaceus]
MPWWMHISGGDIQALVGPTETGASYGPVEPLAEDLDITLPVVDLTITLVEAGYLGNSPEEPTMAISLKALDLYRVLCQRKPSFSFEAFAKVLCDLYQTPYRRQWHIALADAFDVFLTIKHSVHTCLAQALGRSLDNWWVMNSCPPCMYEQMGDLQVFLSDYWVDVPEVDHFMLEDIKLRDPEVPPATWDEEVVEEEGEQETIEKEEKGEVTECVRNWKAVQADSKKRTMEIFDETGWFACGCWHDLILAKYPLAIVNWALEVLGDRLRIGYDIGCAFQGTVMSTTLGKKFAKSKLRSCINVYHGYVHNFACQCTNHPNNIEGCGIEDLKTMEQFVSASNATASSIRYTLKYHWHMLLDLFLQQSDKDKYSHLGLMIQNNYRQALNIIQQSTPLLDDILQQMGAKREDLDTWQHDQAQYFATLGKEPEADIHKVAYVELLQEMEAAEKAANSKTKGFLSTVPGDWDPSQGGQTYNGELSRTWKLKTERQWVCQKLNQLTREVIEMELKMGITT